MKEWHKEVNILDNTGENWEEVGHSFTCWHCWHCWHCRKLGQLHLLTAQLINFSRERSGAAELEQKMLAVVVKFCSRQHQLCSHRHHLCSRQHHLPRHRHHLPRHRHHLLRHRHHLRCHRHHWWIILTWRWTCWPLPWSFAQQVHIL